MAQILTLPYLAQSIATLLGLTVTAAGIRCIVAPQPFATSFGLPSKQGSDSSDFIPVVGARNIAIGLSLLSFSFQGNPQAMGTVLLCGLASCIGDIVVVRLKGDKNAASHHFIVGVVFGGL